MDSWLAVKKQISKCKWAVYFAMKSIRLDQLELKQVDKQTQMLAFNQDQIHAISTKQLYQKILL